MILNEYSQWLRVTNGLKILDVCHAIERFEERFPDLSIEVFYKKLEEGLKKIDRVFGGKNGNYMIVSFSTNLKIQLDKRVDTENNSEVIGVIATVLHRKEQPNNIRNDQDVYIETKLDKKVTRFIKPIIEIKVH